MVQWLLLSLLSLLYWLYIHFYCYHCYWLYTDDKVTATVITAIITNVYTVTATAVTAADYTVKCQKVNLILLKDDVFPFTLTKE
jgi:predicted Rdx family selenoprotein